MANRQLTLFPGLSLAAATLDDTTEKDPHNTGAALTIRKSDANSEVLVPGTGFVAEMPTRF